jgi:hypothetical protein
VINKRLLHDCTMALTAAITEMYRVQDEEEYRETFWTIHPAVEAGILYALEAQQKELRRLGKLRVPPPSEN